MDNKTPKLPLPHYMPTPEELPSAAPSLVHPDLAAKLRNLPLKPGVYMMRDERRRVIYVGKSAQLKNRVNSYFQSSKNHSSRIRWMVSLVRDFDTIVVDSEMEALLLENNLIKKHRPYFNVMFRDDKSYPMLEVTLFETYPRVRTVRQNAKTHPKARRFGPYPDVSALKRTKKMLLKIFKLRTCRAGLAKPLDRPCLNYHINLCSAPCTRQVSVEAYREQIKSAMDFLNGQTSKLVNDLLAELPVQSQALNFERCAVIRDTLADLNVVIKPQKVMVESAQEEDYLASASEGDLTCTVVWQIREGKLLGQQEFMHSAGLEEDQGAQAFIQQYYGSGSRPPKRIFLQHLPLDHALLEEWLTKLRGHKVSIKVPQRGLRLNVLEMALRNAQEKLKTEQAMPSRLDLRQQALEELRDALALPHTPWRIECVDISNTSGQQAVGSLVVFEQGLPARSHYRHFRIKDLDTPNDFAMMEQVLTRRFSHLEPAIESEEQNALVKNAPQTLPKAPDASLSCVPDLLIVDGGKGQLSIAIRVLQHWHISDRVSLAGLAKQQEELFLPHMHEPVYLPRDSQALLMVTHIRNEAHRFAITHHRKLRQRKIRLSRLDEISGIGPQKKRALLTCFGSLTELQNASPADLSQVPGIGPSLAQRLYDSLHNEDSRQP